MLVGKAAAPCSDKSSWIGSIGAENLDGRVIGNEVLLLHFAIVDDTKESSVCCESNHVSGLVEFGLIVVQR